MARKKASVRTPKRAGDKRGKNPASLANLKPPWRAGDPSPNPSGRPKLLGDSYKAMLARVNETDPQKRTNAELANSDALVTLAQQALLATDLTTHAFVQPFLLEQVQSVRELDELTTKLALATGNGAALLLLEHELGEGGQ